MELTTTEILLIRGLKLFNVPKGNAILVMMLLDNMICLYYIMLTFFGPWIIF